MNENRKTDNLVLDESHEILTGNIPQKPKTPSYGKRWNPETNSLEDDLVRPSVQLAVNIIAKTVQGLGIKPKVNPEAAEVKPAEVKPEGIPVEDVLVEEPSMVEVKPSLSI